MIRHPLQDQRVRINQGHYIDCLAKVLSMLPDHGEHGFVEVEITVSGQQKPVIDLVPVPYIDHAEVR